MSHKSQYRAIPRQKCSLLQIVLSYFLLLLLFFGQSWILLDLQKQMCATFPSVGWLPILNPRHNTVLGFRLWCYLKFRHYRIKSKRKNKSNLKWDLESFASPYIDQILLKLCSYWQKKRPAKYSEHEHDEPIKNPPWDLQFLIVLDLQIIDIHQIVLVLLGANHPPCCSFIPHLVGKMVIQAAHECSTQPTTPPKNKSLNLKWSHIQSQLEEKPNIFPQLNQKSSDLFLEAILLNFPPQKKQKQQCNQSHLFVASFLGGSIMSLF